MASPSQWAWIWASSGSWWWTGKPGVLQSMGLQRFRHDWVNELNRNIILLYVYVCMLSRVWLFAVPWTVAHQASLSMGFHRQEYQSGLPFFSPGNLPGPGIKPEFPTLAGGFLNTEPPGKPHLYIYSTYSNRIKSLEKWIPILRVNQVHKNYVGNQTWREKSVAKTWSPIKPLWPYCEVWLRGSPPAWFLSASNLRT